MATFEDNKVVADLTLRRSSAGDSQAQCDAYIGDYLDHVCARLVGFIPYAERQSIREEASFHLHRSAGASLLQGADPEEAARRAIEEYGDSRVISDDLLEAWMHRRVKTRLTRFAGWSVVCALACFTLANAWIAILEQVHIAYVGLQSTSAPVTFGLTPAEIRHFIPRPLPLPESSPTFVLLMASLVLAPLVAGWVTGWLAPVHPVRATYHVQIGLTVYSFLSGFLMLPACYGLLTAVLQLLYWLPAGCLAAHFGAAVRRWHACRYEWGTPA